MIRFFHAITEEDLPLVGGKGLNLGLLCKAGFPVPAGFCVTTDGFWSFVAECPKMAALYEELDQLPLDDLAAAKTLGEKIRSTLSETNLPQALKESLTGAWKQLGPEHSYAVRSSATAEDLPSASFAGQQDTYLNIRGQDALHNAVVRCFVSLFTDRAILYRQKGGFGHRGVALSVVVQRMVFPTASGILFTADPLTGHRGTLSIDAGFGLGEALVSGLINADLYRLDKTSGALRDLRIGDKALQISPTKDGSGTQQVPLEPERRTARVLDNDQLAALHKLGVSVEAHYGGVPQDLEWGFADGVLHLLQARPITSLYPLVSPRPEPGKLRVYFSFSHAQNMTDPISPMGRDILRILMPFGRGDLKKGSPDSDVTCEAGGRIYIDITPVLRVKVLSRLILAIFSGIYADLGAGLAQLALRKEVQAAEGPSWRTLKAFLGLLWRTPFRIVGNLAFYDPHKIPERVKNSVEAAIAHFRSGLTGTPTEQLAQLTTMFPQVFPRLVHLPPLLGSGVLALKKLRQHFAGTPQAADVEALQRGLIGNITTEMDLQVGDLADQVRPYPALKEALCSPSGRDLDTLGTLDGGAEFRAAFESFLQRFGMRGQAEIDIGRQRFADSPALLLSTIAGMLKNPEAGTHRKHFAKLQREAEEVSKRLVQAAGGPLATQKVRRLVKLVRFALGMREHPKFALVSCLQTARGVILANANKLVEEGLLSNAQDVWFLRYAELLAASRGDRSRDLKTLVSTRKKEHETFRHLSPPLIVTSEGEVPVLVNKKDLPKGALAGLGASSGTIEGIARVILDPNVDVLHAGEILVAPYTDPGWTPLFVHAAGLICEVGGMMTHGSVVAREYGIPAVVGVAGATKVLRSGQRIRLDGTSGYVQILDQEVTK